MNKGRYEIRGVLGEGAMGIVYGAVDPVMNNRDVAVKTIRDAQDRAALELFRRECSVLATLSHPNIVEIFDMGEAEETGGRRPFFVMPLLRGATLQELIRTSSTRLTIERSIQMISQVCRGLQAAHDHGLIHRDLKPSNLFVLTDDSVKIIDFGMAHLLNHRSATGLKGTLLYMAPEQIHLKQPSPLSDQFSVAVICYEMLARRHPFTGEPDLAEAIVHFTPPSVSQFNPAVSQAISQVIHKALAKDAFHRFSSVREFSDLLQKALHGEAIDIFDPARIAPRLQRAQRAFDSGDLDDAADIIKGLESENPLAPEIGVLSKQIEDTRRAKTVKQLIETARRRLDEGEYVRALQKVQDILDLDPANTEAFTLKGAIESKRSGTQIEEWFRLANQHLQNNAYPHARQALEKVLEIRPKEPRAQILLAEVERREQESIRLRNERQQAYQSALDAYRRGEVNSALNKLERVLDLDRRAPQSNSSEEGAAYQRLYEEVRSRRDQIASKEAEARRALAEGNFNVARALCEEVLSAFPNNVLFRVLEDDIEQAQRLEISAYVAKIEKDVAVEPDLNRKCSILEEAGEKYPLEPRFAQLLQQIRARRDLVDSVVGRARTVEEEKQFSEALVLWEMLRKIYPQYPGLDVELERLQRRREQQVRTDAKAHWVTQIDQALSVRNYEKALSLALDGLVEHPGDVELAALEKQVRQSQARALDAEEKANEAKALQGNGSTREALDLLREASELDPHHPAVRSALSEALLNEARVRLDVDWRTAVPLVQEVLDFDSTNPLARSLSTLIDDKRQVDEVSTALSHAREIQSNGNTRKAIAEVDRMREKYPQEKRLINFRQVLLESLSTEDRDHLRIRDLAELSRLVEESREAKDVKALESIFERSHAFTKYDNDAEFRESLSAIETRLRAERGVGKTPDVQPLQHAPVPIEPPAPALAAPQGQRPSRLTRTSKQIIGIAAGFAVMLLILFSSTVRWPHLTRGGQASEVENSGPVPVKVVVDANEGQFAVVDSSNAPVTEKLSTGLAAGRYTLRAHKPGFHGEQTFDIDPREGAQKNLTVKWEAFPTIAKIKVTQVAGAVKVDDQEPKSDDANFMLSNGHHVIDWRRSVGDFVRLELTVADDVVKVDEPKIHAPNITGIIFVVSRGEAHYWAIGSVSGVYKSVNEKADEPVPQTGIFVFRGVSPVRFKRRADSMMLGDMSPEASGAPVVSIFIARSSKPAGANSTIQIPKASPMEQSPPPPATPIVTPLPTPQQPSAADLEKQRQDEIRRKREAAQLPIKKQ